MGIASVIVDPSTPSFLEVRSLVARLMLANLAHETKAKPFAEIIQVVLDRFQRLIASFNEVAQDPADLVATTQAMSVCVAVRKGKRVDGTLLLNQQPVHGLLTFLPQNRLHQRQVVRDLTCSGNCITYRT